MTIDSTPRPSVPKTNGPTRSKSAAMPLTSVAAAPSPNMVRTLRSRGLTNFEYVSAGIDEFRIGLGGDEQEVPGYTALDEALAQRQAVDPSRATLPQIDGSTAR